MTSSSSSLRFALLASLALVACSSGGGSSSSKGSPPVITTLQLPSTFTVSNGDYTAQGTIAFQAGSAAITTLHEKIPAYNLDSTEAVPSIGNTGMAEIIVGFVSSATIASGTQVQIDVSLIDANGNESNVETEQVSVP